MTSTIAELDKVWTTLDRCRGRVGGAALQREVDEALALVSSWRAEALEAKTADRAEWGPDPVLVTRRRP